MRRAGHSRSSSYPAISTKKNSSPIRWQKNSATVPKAASTATTQRMALAPARSSRRRATARCRWRRRNSRSRAAAWRCRRPGRRPAATACMLPNSGTAVGDGADHRQQDGDPDDDATGQMDRQHCSSGGRTRSVPRLGMIVQCVAYMRDRTGSDVPERQHHRARQMVGIVEQRRHIDQRQRCQQDQAQQGQCPFHAGT